ncbi:GerAB/ArcD/ProY family transporter [Clostridium rectalis]|uniref:GerAB/ArcD/ProY family transporter n=1 Tax=Clostridium rectalis TaxID=2040295 RepID=UPI0013DDF194|nr:endospore germination permease [Clostridium rectalis]
MDDKNFISSYALFATIIVTTVGVNVFSYPRELTEVVNGDGWIVIILATILAFIFMSLIYQTMKNNKYIHFYDLIEKNTGRFIGKLIGLSFIIYSIIVISVGLRVFTEEIKVYLLQRTPTEFIFIFTILTGVYLVRGEIDTLIKFNEVAFWLMFIPVFLVLLFSIYDSDFSNILPLLNNKPMNYIHGITMSMYRYSGFPILFLILPFVKEKKKINKVILKSLIFIGLFYVITFILVIGMFGKEQTKILLWPVITLIRTIDIPGTFVERWEGIIMAIWVIFYYTTFTNLFYFAADMLKKMCKFNDVKLSVPIIVPFIYLIALYPQNVVQVAQISSKYVPMLGVINFVILPIILLIITKVRKGGRKNPV